MKLEGKKTLVVGASSGVGLATAELFAAEGAQVAIAARSTERLQGVAATIGDKAHVVVGDVADPVSCAAIVSQAIAAMGGLDVVVYCAWLVQPCLVKDMSVQSFKEHIDVNLTGNFIIAQAAALYMKANGGGSIVNISSELSHIGMGYYVHYCAAKAGVLGLTKALAAEMAPDVRVNSVSPGPVDTPMLQAEIDWFGGGKDVLDGAINRVPLKRFAQPAEIARAILFLAEADYATGSTLVLDGGTTMV